MTVKSFAMEEEEVGKVGEVDMGDNLEALEGVNLEVFDISS